MWSLRHSNVAAWAVPWNVIGQPAASIPAGFDTHGLPLSVQLCAPRRGQRRSSTWLPSSKQLGLGHHDTHQNSAGPGSTPTRPGDRCCC